MNLRDELPLLSTKIFMVKPKEFESQEFENLQNINARHLTRKSVQAGTYYMLKSFLQVETPLNPTLSGSQRLFAVRNLGLQSPTSIKEPQ